jgi:signal transduction histidine kinase
MIGPVLPRRARLFTVLALVCVGTVSAAGVWTIATSRRQAAEEATRRFAWDTQGRGRALERLLAATRADLSFLAGSPPISRLLASADASAGSLRSEPREAAEAAVLLFLRAHPEVTRVAVRHPDERPLLLAGRRGGVPILWVAPNPTGSEGPAVSADRPRVATLVPFEGRPAPASGRVSGLLAEVAPEVLLAANDAGAALGDRDGGTTCRILDAGGRVLGRGGPAPAGEKIQADTPLAAEGWSAASPWRLHCEQARARALSLVEPLAARYRTTLVLSLGAMAMAVLLGLLAVREVRHRERFEAQAREEVRVREVERQLFHAERLITAGRLAAGIAHEINNPLEAMANYISLTRDALERGDTEAARRRLDSVRQGLDRAAQVVRQVLQHADSASAPRAPVDLNRVLSETVEFVGSRPEFSRVRFETALADKPVVVDGNAVMLGQLALNLIVNACEAQPQGGEVRVSSSREGARARAEVADRGPGIPDTERERIFEPFFSTKNSTGLGLSICHAIVRQHGGQVVAVPREAGGTVFRVELPAAGAAAEAR